MTLNELMTEIAEISLSSTITNLTSYVKETEPVAKDYQRITTISVSMSFLEYISKNDNQIQHDFGIMQDKSILVSCFVRAYQQDEVLADLRQLKPLLLQANKSSAAWAWHSGILKTDSADYVILNLFLTNNDQPYLIYPGLDCATDLCNRLSEQHVSFAQVVNELKAPIYIWHEKDVRDFFTKQIVYLDHNQAETNQKLTTLWNSEVEKLFEETIRKQSMHIVDLNWLFKTLTPKSYVNQKELQAKIMQPEEQRILQYLAQTFTK